MAEPKSRKTRIISFRVTDSEFMRLSHKAASADLPVNSLARRLTLSQVEKLVIKASRNHDPALVKQLYYIGHNINQLVKNAHIFGRVSPRIEELCRRIDALMDEAMAQEDEQ